MKKSPAVTLIVTIALALTATGLAADRPRPFEGCPFTQPPRSMRSRDADHQHVRLELDFNWEQQEIRGRAIHTLSPFVPLQKIVLDAAEMKIERVALADGNGNPKERKLTFSSRGDKLTIMLDRR